MGARTQLAKVERIWEFLLHKENAEHAEIDAGKLLG